MSVRNGCTIEIYGFMHSLHTFLACAAHNAIMMEVEDWEDSSLVPKHYTFVACTMMHMRIPSILCIHVNNDAYEGEGVKTGAPMLRPYAITAVQLHL